MAHTFNIRKKIEGINDEARIVLHTAVSDEYRDPYKYQEYAKRHGRAALAKQIADIFTAYIPAILAEQGSHLLDMAAGTGLISAALTERGYDVTATDINSSMLVFLRQQYPDIHIVQANFNESLPFETGQFDGATQVWGNRYLTRAGLPIFISELHRILKDGGILIWPIFPVEIPFWKLRAGLFQPTTTSSLSKVMSEKG